MRTPHAKLLVFCLNFWCGQTLAQVLQFLREERPGVVLCQELRTGDIPAFERLGYRVEFAPMSTYDDGRTTGQWGLGILSRCDLSEVREFVYRVGNGSFPDRSIRSDIRPAQRELVFAATADVEGVPFMLATTHFTWAPRAIYPTEVQLASAERMSRVLDLFPEVVLGVDLNTARGAEIFDGLAARLRDNVPAHVKSTIDGRFHYDGALPIVVDGIFTSPQYLVEDVQIVSGLSDHKGFLVNVTRI